MLMLNEYSHAVVDTCSHCLLSAARAASSRLYAILISSLIYVLRRAFFFFKARHDSHQSQQRRCCYAAARFATSFRHAALPTLVACHVIMAFCYAVT